MLLIETSKPLSWFRINHFKISPQKPLSQISFVLWSFIHSCGPIQGTCSKTTLSLDGGAHTNTSVSAGEGEEEENPCMNTTSVWGKPAVYVKKTPKNHVLCIKYNRVPFLLNFVLYLYIKLYFFKSIQIKCSNTQVFHILSKERYHNWLFSAEPYKSKMSNILGNKMSLLCLIYKNILWVTPQSPDEAPLEILRVNRVQTGPIRQPVCLSVGTHSSQQGGWFVWNATATNRAPKKEGKHLLLSLLDTHRRQSVLFVIRCASNVVQERITKEKLLYVSEEKNINSVFK